MRSYKPKIQYCFIFTYVITVFLFPHGFELHPSVLSAWRTPYSISCRACLLAKNSAFLYLRMSPFRKDILPDTEFLLDITTLYMESLYLLVSVVSDEQ